MIDHSKSENSQHRGVMFAPPKELDSSLASRRKQMYEFIA